MSRTLVLIPTDPERRLLVPRLASALGDAGRIELCGFGPVAAAARTAGLLASGAPAACCWSASPAGSTTGSDSAGPTGSPRSPATASVPARARVSAGRGPRLAAVAR